MERQIKLIWDFRGFGALPTATHHEIHIKEFIKNNNLEHFPITGVETFNEMHATAYWVVAESQIKTYRDILKPHRATVYTEGENK